jgi:hypothetical protein
VTFSEYSFRWLLHKCVFVERRVHFDATAHANSIRVALVPDFDNRAGLQTACDVGQNFVADLESQRRTVVQRQAKHLFDSRTRQIATDETESIFSLRILGPFVVRERTAEQHVNTLENERMEMNVCMNAEAHRETIT